jgi:hypothetical protein
MSCNVSTKCLQLFNDRLANGTKGFSALFLLEVLCRMAYEGSLLLLHKPYPVHAEGRDDGKTIS